MRSTYVWLGATLAIIGVASYALTVMLEPDGSPARTGFRVGISAVFSLVGAFWIYKSTMRASIERGLAAAVHLEAHDPIEDATRVLRRILLLDVTINVLLVAGALAWKQTLTLGMVGTMLGGAQLLTVRWVGQLERSNNATLVSRAGPRGQSRRRTAHYAFLVRQPTPVQ
ncbi:MAG: hypothetical protein QOH57_565 [Mycobacterium sp.]|nr:hypothetical protein [Mycobacterium sp.]